MKNNQVELVRLRWFTFTVVIKMRARLSRIFVKCSRKLKIMVATADKKLNLRRRRKREKMWVELINAPMYIVYC